MSQSLSCLQCERSLAPTDPRHEVEGGVFCEDCFQQLRSAVARAISSQGEGVSYGRAALGGLGGGLAGALVWWGFTVLTHIALGLVAIVIGYAVGYGVLRVGGYKRSVELQFLSAGISLGAFVFASLLVNWTFLNEAMAKAGLGAVPLFSEPSVLIEILKAGFEPMDILFLAIVVYEAWKIPAPLRLG